MSLNDKNNPYPYNEADAYQEACDSEQYHLNKTTKPSWGDVPPEDINGIDMRSKSTPTENSKYDKRIHGKFGDVCIVDVYRVLSAFEVTSPQLQHLIKKALATGQRGHKTEREDLVDILHSAQSALDMYDDKASNTILGRNL